MHRGIAQIIGTARHHDIEISLLRSQIEMSTLSTDLALRMAEHGLRDNRLANALADLGCPQPRSTGARPRGCTVPPPTPGRRR